MPESTFSLDPAHPAFAGHFPGRPILPGVALLDHVIGAIEADPASGGSAFVTRHTLAQVKFHEPALPGATLSIRLDFEPTGAVAFSVSEQGRPIASGRFVPLRKA